MEYTPPKVLLKEFAKKREKNLNLSLKSHLHVLIVQFTTCTQFLNGWNCFAFLMLVFHPVATLLLNVYIAL